MQTIDLTPQSTPIKYLVGQTWKWPFAFNNVPDINLTEYQITCLILQDGTLIDTLNKSNGIEVASNGKSFVVTKDWITITTQDTTNLPTLDPLYNQIIKGVFNVQFIFTNAQGQDYVPAFFTVEVTDKPSDVSSFRPNSDLLFLLTFNDGQFFGISVTAAQRIEFTTVDGVIYARNFGDTEFQLLADFTTFFSDAFTARNQAVQSANNAANSAGIATTKANQASQSATNAANSASTTTTKATEASQSANNASSSASTATTKATEASQSANNAANSASTATTKANEASQSANNAASSASTATTKANEASQSANTASNSASTATTKANDASQSATSAEQSYVAAATSANEALGYVNDANQAAGIASQKRDQAVAAAATALQASNDSLIALQGTQTASASAYLSKQAAENAANSVLSILEKSISKVASVAALPAIGDINTIYFIDIATPVLKIWDGAAYQNSTKVSDLLRDYYAKYSDINLASYAGKFRMICVIKDSTYGDNTQLYFSTGTTLIASITFPIPS